MSAVWIVIAVHAGLFAVGFGMAGVLQFREFGRMERDELVTAGIDPIGIVMFLQMLAAVVENWGRVATGRRFIYAALVCLGVMATAWMRV
jgi:hypothetical protein